MIRVGEIPSKPSLLITRSTIRESSPRQITEESSASRDGQPETGAVLFFAERPKKKKKVSTNPNETDDPKKQFCLSISTIPFCQKQCQMRKRGVPKEECESDAEKEKK